MGVNKARECVCPEKPGCCIPLRLSPGPSPVAQIVWQSSGVCLCALELGRVMAITLRGSDRALPHSDSAAELEHSMAITCRCSFSAIAAGAAVAAVAAVALAPGTRSECACSLPHPFAAHSLALTPEAHNNGAQAFTQTVTRKSARETGERDIYGRSARYRDEREREREREGERE